MNKNHIRLDRARQLRVGLQKDQERVKVDLGGHGVRRLDLEILEAGQDVEQISVPSGQQNKKKRKPIKIIRRWGDGRRGGLEAIGEQLELGLLDAQRVKHGRVEPGTNRVQQHGQRLRPPKELVGAEQPLGDQQPLLLCPLNRRKENDDALEERSVLLVGKLVLGELAA